MGILDIANQMLEDDPRKYCDTLNDAVRKYGRAAILDAYLNYHGIFGYTHGIIEVLEELGIDLED